MTIRQFDVVANPISATRTERPYLVCVQDRQLEHLATRLVASLVTGRIIAEESRLHPKFEIYGKALYLVPYDLLALPLRLLRAPVANLDGERYRIISALDLVFTGA